MDRRDLLKRGAVAGAVAWTAPVILSGNAYAAEGGGGTAKCRPSISVSCAAFDCQQGNKFLPGINLNVGGCPCGAQAAHVCARVDIVANTCGTLVAYGPGTSCGPQNTDTILNAGAWRCIPSSGTIIFGPPRSGGGNGAIPNMSNCTITARLSVWAGNCPDMDSANQAYNCRTFDVFMNWGSTSFVTPCAPVQSAVTTHCSAATQTPPCTCP